MKVQYLKSGECKMTDVNDDFVEDDETTEPAGSPSDAVFTAPGDYSHIRLSDFHWPERDEIGGWINDL